MLCLFPFSLFPPSHAPTTPPPLSHAHIFTSSFHDASKHETMLRYKLVGCFDVTLFTACVAPTLLSPPTVFFPLSASPLVCVFHQSIFMFPLSFSSSSSLSSIPPSLDSISELERGLSDISEDDDLTDDASHAPWSLSLSASSPFSDQQLVDFESFAQNQLQTSCPVTISQTCSPELPGAEEEEGGQAESRAAARVARWWSWFSLRGVAKCVSIILCFLSLLGKRANRCLPTKLFSGFTKKLSLFTPTLPKPSCMSVGQFRILSVRVPQLIHSISALRLRLLNSIALKLAQLVVFIRRDLPAKCTSLVPAVPGPPAHLPSFIALASFLSSFPSLSSLPSYFRPSRSLLRLSSASCSSELPPGVHRYLLNPSPLLLPGLLVLFLLVVMLTASQSLALALVLATPLGLTLCYLESVVSSQRRLALLPVFNPDDQSEFNRLEAPPLLLPPLPLSPTHTPPRIRAHAHTAVAATWTPEMCDPAA